MTERKRISLSPSAFAKKRFANSSFQIDLTRPPFFDKRPCLGLFSVGKGDCAETTAGTTHNFILPLRLASVQYKYSSELLAVLGKSR